MQRKLSPFETEGLWRLIASELASVEKIDSRAVTGAVNTALFAVGRAGSILRQGVTVRREGGIIGHRFELDADGDLTVMDVRD